MPSPVSGAAVALALAIGVMSGTGALVTSSATAVSSAVGLFGIVTGNLAASSSATGHISATGSLNGFAASAVAIANGNLVIHGVLTSSPATAVASSLGLLSGHGLLTAHGSAIATPVGNLKGNSPTIGSLIGSAAAVGNLSGLSNLISTISARFLDNSTLTGFVPISIVSDIPVAIAPIIRIQGIPSMALPYPVRLEPFRAGSTDTRGLDLAAALSIEQDTIASIGSLSVRRRDGIPMGVNDLSLTPTGFAAPTITGSLVVNWWQKAGATIAALGAVDYVISVSFTTAQGRPLIYDAFQLVTPTLG